MKTLWLISLVVTDWDEYEINHVGYVESEEEAQRLVDSFNKRIPKLVKLAKTVKKKLHRKYYKTTPYVPAPPSLEIKVRLGTLHYISRYPQAEYEAIELLNINVK